MKFVRFDSLECVKDGDQFLVLYPNGVIVLCYFSDKGYFRPEVDYGSIYDAGLEELPSVQVEDHLLVCKF